MHPLASVEMAIPSFRMQPEAKALGLPWECGDVRSLLKEILSDSEILKQVAARSYVHQLGFEKFVLAESVDGSAIRLHFWPHGSSSVDEDIHSHCGSFSSLVVLGSLTSQLYELNPGSTHMAYRYRFDRIKRHSEVTKAGLTTVAAAQQTTFNIGFGYRLDSHVLHRVIDVMPGTATISIWSQRHSDAIVIKELHSHPENCVRKAGMTLFLVKSRLTHILEMIDKNDT
jgi:hypothetical protein